jgi:photosystem II stability/assembly factor-like uncharacterized protein
MKIKHLSIIITIAWTFQYLSAIAAGPWTPLNGPFGYNSPQTIIHHQGAIYASSNINGSSGTGVWKTTDAGNSWTNVSSGLPKPYARDIEALGNLIFVASDTGVYSSSNQGLTWISADNTLPDFTNVYELAVHQGELYAAVYFGSGTVELYKTGNNGQSWTFTGYSLSFSISLNQLFSSGNTLWASTSAGVFKSIDGGATFNAASNNIPFSASINSLVAQGDTAYCGTSNGSYFTTDGGQMWTPIVIPALGNPIYCYSWKIIGNTVYAGLYNNGIYSSTLGQSNWNVFGTGYYGYSLPWMLTQDGTSLFAATAEGIFSCPIAGGNWLPKNGNITRARTTIGWADNNLVLAGSGFYSGLKRTQNGGATWTNTSIVNQQGLYRNGIKINNTIIIPSSYTMYTSTDDGLTWTNPFVAPIPNNDIAKYGNSIIAPSGNNVVYSNDVGQTWNIYSSGIPSNGSVYAVGVMGQSAYAGVNNSIYKMEYPGAPWTNFSQGLQSNGLISSILSIGNTLVANSTLGIYRKTIEDSLWRNVNPNAPVIDIIYANDFIWSAGYNGVYFSDNLGKTFHPWNDGFPDYMGQIENLFADGDVLYAGSQEFSAWKRTIEPEITITNAPSSSVCTGSIISVSALSTVALNAGNKYYLQLSDRYGRFLNPIILDSVTSIAASVTLNGLLPDSLPTGTEYKVRIVSSSPYLLATACTNYFTILQRPTINLQPANQNACQGQGTGFYVGAAGDSLSYQWQVDQSGAGFYTNLNNNATYQDVNSSLLLITSPTPIMNGYRYRCQISNSCGITLSNFGTLTVNAITATVTGQPVATTVCSGQAASFTLTAAGSGLSYQWQVNSGFGVFSTISNGSQYTGVNTSSLIVNFTTANMDGYIYRCKIGTCLYTDSVALIVNGEPVTASVLSQEPFCDGGTAKFNVVVAGAGISYQWEEDNGTGFTPVINGPNYSGANAPILQLMNIPASYNNYLYRCTITGLCSPGSSSSNNGELILSPSPTVVTQPVSSTICEGDSASFTTTGSGSFLYYNWEMNTGNGWAPVPPLPPYSGVNSSTLQLSQTSASMQSNLFRCRMSGCVSSNDASLNLLSVPTVSVNNLIICTNQLPYTLNGAVPNGGVYYGNGIYTGSFDPFGSNTGQYLYNYFYTSPNGCSASATGNIMLTSCTDISESFVENNTISLFPNPAKETLTLSFGTPVKSVSRIQLFSLDGRLMEKINVPSGENKIEINVSGYPEGLYLLKITNALLSESRRLLILH